ncbi:HupE/UreJ family protein [Hahella ganghwensis]|uniref:HupE/UreJ family protein n=1 Tax=Hahella ganghwensis TaxID=286420 RepID=UPI0003685FDD|nr:HupE/UreJ family protein [Hahella ganghwensis]
MTSTHRPLCNIRYSRALTGMALLSTPLVAAAHPGHDTVLGFISGLQHPFFGLDHLVTMIALGFIATKLNARTSTIMTFSLGMLGGGIIALSGITIPFVEYLIVASLIAVALVLLNSQFKDFRLMYALPLVAFFAACHGWAHVAEQPADLSSVWYMVGMISGATILQLGGLALSVWLQHKIAARKLMGGAALTTAVISAAGLMLG